MSITERGAVAVLILSTVVEWSMFGLFETSALLAMSLFCTAVTAVTYITLRK